MRSFPLFLGDYMATIRLKVGASNWNDVVGEKNSTTIIDNLESGSSDAALSAKQGNILSGKITEAMQNAGVKLGETSSTAFAGDKGKIAYAHAQNKGIAVENGLYKFTTNSEGHITAVSAVDNATTSAAGLMSPEDKAKLDKSSVIIVSDTEPTEECDLWIDTSSGATGGSGALLTKEAVIAALGYSPARCYSYTGTLLASGWSSVAPYTQTITIQGIIATDEPFFDLNMTNATVDNAGDLAKNWVLVKKLEAGANSIIATCYDSAPTIDLPMNIKVIK